ncbi:HNH endonuclease [Pyxidicoccus sp. 3LFB2]
MLSLGEEREYAGNAGYADEPESVYRYDSFVPNHRNVVEGDLMVLRNKERVLGIANVVRLERSKGTKRLSRCPQCGIATIKERKEKRPRYRCREKHTFDKPRVTVEKCTHFAAWFDGTFKPVEGVIPVEAVRPACPRFNGQLAMQQVVLDSLEGAAKSLRRLSETVPVVRPRGIPVAADAPEEPYALNARDERARVPREINARRGQPAFRKKLLERFKNTCVVTGCRLPDLLEAAHIAPYRGQKDHHPSNGLLLRTDIHTLFDLDLLGIEPETLKVHLHPRVEGSGYEAWAGVSLSCDSKLLSRDALLSRWLKFRAR